MEREIYTEINDQSAVSHPPKSVKIEDLSGALSGVKSDFKAPVSVEVYIHSAHCTNPQSRSLGSDFDGYIRITLKDENRTIARAQMDYKGEPTDQSIRQVYDHLLKKMEW